MNAPVEPDIAGDASRVFDCLRDGGVAIIYMDVAYAIMSGTEDALRRVYEAKGRSPDVASGVVANLATHDAIQQLDDAARRIVRRVVEAHDLPMSVIAPYDATHPLMAALTPYLTSMGTVDGTVNFLLNSGPLRDRIADLSLAASHPLIASSANRSKQGTKYRVEDIEPEVLAAADLVIDYGPSKYLQTGFALSSTQIDFRDMSVVRRGVCFDAIAAVFRDEFGIALT